MIAAAALSHASTVFAADAAGAIPVPASVSSLRSGLDLEGFDRSVRPQDDLYRFAGGTWLARTEIPADRSNFGTFSKLEDDALATLRELVESAAADPQRTPGSDAQKLGDFYTAFMDTKAIETRGIAPLESELSRIASLSTYDDVFAFFGRAQRLGIGSPIGAYVGQDRRQSTRYIPGVSQSGLTMPDREYYLADDARNAKARADLAVYAEKLLSLSGTTDAGAAAARIVALETAIARLHWTRVENRDPVKTYNRTAISEATVAMPAFGWKAFIDGMGPEASAISEFDIRQPSYVKQLGELVRATPVTTWREYFRFRLLDANASFLPTAYDAARFDFRERALRGVQAQQPRWRRSLTLIDRSIGEIAGRLYVERTFPPEARTRIRELVANLRVAFEQSIDSLDWMGPQTKEEAKRKLAAFSVKVGYPDKWRDYSRLDVRPDDLLGNLRRVNEFEFLRQMDRLGKPVDRSEWGMTPQTVNAYYSPPMNEIVFPAAILQPPFFNLQADDAINYGGIGAVIGHEISHGFDDSGSKYDGKGNLRNWWTENDQNEFVKRSDQLVKQYDQYQPLPGINLNGKFTLGENIGDLGGLSVAYTAYKLSLGGQKSPSMDGFTGEQRFFIGWGQVWRRKYREAEMRKRIKTDPHSPSQYRCNGIVSNLDAYYEAFGVEPGSPMYIEPTKRVRIW